MKPKLDWFDFVVVIIVSLIIGLLAAKCFSSPSSNAGSESSVKGAASALLFSPLGGGSESSGPPAIIKKAAERNGCRGEDYLILLAIRKAENGRKGCEFGVKGKAWGTDLNTQAAWAAATIVKNRGRYESAGRPGDFISYLAQHYCPLDAKNWQRNVKFWFERYKK